MGNAKPPGGVHRASLRVRGGEDVADGRVRGDVRDLREVAVPEARLHHEVVEVQLRLAGDELKSVDLPAPFGPTSATLSPAWIKKSACSRTRVGPKDFRRSRPARIGSMFGGSFTRRRLGFA